MTPSNHLITRICLTWTLILVTMLPTSIVQSKDAETEKDDKDLAIGVIGSIEGDSITVQSPESKDSKNSRTLRLTKDSKIQYVGFKGSGQTADSPKVGYGVKAGVAQGDIIKGMILTPPIPALKQIPDKQKLTAEQLFKATDQNQNGQVDYVEYSNWIFQSYKHLPDRWGAKLDHNHDDILDLPEFTDSLAELPWWRTTRKTAAEWVSEADKDKSGELNMEETKSVTGSAHGKFEQLFTKLDNDKSGGISVSELQPFLDSALRGKKRDRQE